MRIYNSLTRKVEEFKPLKKGKVGIYTCGLTVYDYMHIGHARTYVFADILRRTLVYLGYKVTHVRNITDVGHLVDDADEGEDKMNKAAREKGKTPKEIAAFYEQDAWEVEKALNILKPTKVVYATDHIKEMIEMVKVLEKKGYLYKRDDGLYFDVSKFPDYGKLGGFDWRAQKPGTRVPIRQQKRNLQDFAVWKFAHEHHLQKWDSPWGKSFPGWHIECSAMSMKYLGETFDIHTGGADHIQVHHNNEIAQSEAYSGKKFVNYWMHAGHLLVDGKKMSKSLKNFYRLVDLEKRGYEPLALRYLYLTAHYRQILNFTWKGLESASKALSKLKTRVSELETTKEGIKSNKGKEYRAKFLDLISNDLKMPEALAVVWEVVKDRKLSDGEKRKLVEEFDKVLGLDLGRTGEESRAPEKVQELVEERGELRKQGKYGKADEIRKKIGKQGWVVEDTARGTVVKRKGRNLS